MDESEIFVDVSYYDIPSWGHLPNMFKINIRSGEMQVVALRFQTTQGEAACMLIASKCQVLLEKQQLKQASEAKCQPEHIAITGSKTTTLELSPSKSKSGIFQSNLFYYSRQKLSQERWEANKVKKEKRACVLWGFMEAASPVKNRKPKMAIPKGDQDFDQFMSTMNKMNEMKHVQPQTKSKDLESMEKSLQPPKESYPRGVVAEVYTTAQAQVA